MWVEKYRPKVYLDIKGQDFALKKIKEFNLNKKIKIRKQQKLRLKFPSLRFLLFQFHLFLGQLRF